MEEDDFYTGDSDSQSPETFGIPVASTPIVMVSLPESLPEDFETPPEDCFPASSEEQRLPAEAANVLDGRNEAASRGEGGTDSERAVDLGKDSDNLGFSRVKSTLVIDGGCVDISRDGDEAAVECEGFVVLQRKSGSLCDEIASKKSTASDENLGVSESIHNENAKTDTEVLDLKTDNSGERLGEDHMFVDLPMRATDVGVVLGKGDEVCKHGNGGLARKNVEDLDKIKGVGPSEVNRKVTASGGGGWRRELPPSISDQDKTMGGEAGSGTSAGTNKILNGILDALKLVTPKLDDGSEEEEEVDFLETAKKRGMTFPRPRWWPPEGYDD